MNRRLNVFLVLALLAILSVICRAAEVTEEETTERYLGKSEEKAYKKVEMVRERKRYTTKLFVSAMQGYDNNVFLDPRRKEDTFSEAIVDASIFYPLTGRWGLFGGLSAHDITYWEATDANLVDTDVKLGVEGKLFWNITATLLNDIEMVEYISNDDGTYLGDKVDLALKQRLPHNLFHAFGYEYFYKNYSDRKARNGWGGLSSKDRIDHRNTIDYEIGSYFKNMMIKLKAEYFMNKSNDAFMNYYDYDSFRYGPSLIYLVTDKLSAYMSYTKQIKRYDDRTIPGDTTRHEKDHGYVSSASLFYEVRKNMTLGLSYTYRQQHSNYPAQKYSGSITSLGLYCRF